MKYLFSAILITVLYAACHKDTRPDGLLADTIAGTWACGICANTDQEWSFNDTAQVATQTYTAPGGQVWQNKFHYWTVRDTIKIFNTDNYTLSSWVVFFDDPNTCKVTAVGQDLQPIRLLIRK